MHSRRYPALLVALAVAACAPREPMPLTPPGETESAPVVRRPAEPATAPSRAAVPPSPLAADVLPPLAGVAVPPEAIYVCVVEQGGQRSTTVIEFAPKVLDLCRKHPEMGPCQYERNVCRASRGRVFAANGREITMATEAEYDKKVRRVRFTAK